MTTPHWALNLPQELWGWTQVTHQHDKAHTETAPPPPPRFVRHEPSAEDLGRDESPHKAGTIRDSHQGEGKVGVGWEEEGAGMGLVTSF